MVWLWWNRNWRIQNGFTHMSGASKGWLQMLETDLIWLCTSKCLDVFLGDCLQRAWKQKLEGLCISFLLLLYNYHKCNGLNNTDVLSYSSRGQKSEMSLTEWRERPIGRLSGESISLPFSVCGSHTHPLALSPLLYLQSQQWGAQSFSCYIPLASLLASLFCLKGSLWLY